LFQEQTTPVTVFPCLRRTKGKTVQAGVDMKSGKQAILRTIL
jgi:hypothetical protein